MKVLVGLTGASGSIYGIKLVEYLKEKNCEVYMTATDTGLEVSLFETGVNLKKRAKDLNIPFYPIDDFFAPPSSGSFRMDAVVILPCSMGSLARIAGGMSTNFLERAADVALKEKFKLIISPRETPLNLIHIDNMKKLIQAGAIITPPSIAFYTKPKSIDEIINFHVGKICDILGVDHSFFRRWGDV